MRHQPAEQKFRFPGPDIIHRHRPEDDAVVEQHDDRAEAPGHAQREREDRHFDVMGHQKRRERSLLSGKPILGRLFFFCDPLGGVLEQVGKRHKGGLGCRIQSEGKSAKCGACQRDGQRHPEGSNVPAESLWQGLKEPLKGKNAAPPLASFMKLSVAAGDQVLQVAPGFGFR